MGIARLFCVFSTFLIIATAHADIYVRPTKAVYSDELKQSTRAKIESDDQYAQRYFQATSKLLNAEKETGVSLSNLDNVIAGVENEMRQCISKAGKLPSGTVVFKNKETSQGYTAIDGKPVPSSDVGAIQPRTNISSWEEYVALYKRRKTHLEERTEIIKYKEETLAASRKKMPDPDILGLSEKRKKEWLAYKTQ